MGTPWDCSSTQPVLVALDFCSINSEFDRVRDTNHGFCFIKLEETKRRRKENNVKRRGNRKRKNPVECLHDLYLLINFSCALSLLN